MWHADELTRGHFKKIKKNFKNLKKKFKKLIKIKIKKNSKKPRSDTW